MNYEVQGWRGLTSVENPSTVVGRARQRFALSTVAIGHDGSDEQRAARMHNRATAVGQVFHGGFVLTISSQASTADRFANLTARRIDSRAARFSTTPEYLKL